VNVDAPLWVLLAASALGGAALTGLVTLWTKLLDVRHRHDDSRRDYYVSLLAAVDATQGALVHAVAEANRYVTAYYGGQLTDDSERAEATERVEQSRREVVDRYDAARLALHSALLFAPRRVVDPLARIMLHLSHGLARLDEALGALTSQTSLAPPDFPYADWTVLRNAIRRELGVRRLRAEDAPPPPLLERDHM
jgi:hypothetical protein